MGQTKSILNLNDALVVSTWPWRLLEVVQFTHIKTDGDT